MNTAVVYSVNDPSKPTSTLVVLLGNPNDYVSKVGDLSAHASTKYLTRTHHDHYHAVAVDSNRSRIYYSNNALGSIEHSLYIVNDDTNYRTYLAPPITNVVSLTVVCFNSCFATFRLEFLYFSNACLLYTSPSPRDRQTSRMPSSA